MAKEKLHFRYAIIGNSAAGLNCLTSIRKVDKEGSIVVLADEPHMPYSRVVLSYLVGARTEEKTLQIADAQFFRDLDAETIFGPAVESIDPKQHLLFLADGRVIEYEKVLISTGARPTIPDIHGKDLEGVGGLRSLDDAREFMRLGTPGKKAVVMGGGLVGVQSAYSLWLRGCDVTLVVTSPQIFSRYIPQEGARFMENRMPKERIQIILREDVVGFEGDGNGAVRKALLRSGGELDCDLAIVGKGVIPNTDIAKGTGIKIDWGITVNNFMATSVEDVYAAGDVAETADFQTGKVDTSAIWPTAVEQGKIAGANMAGKRIRYAGNFNMNVSSTFNCTMSAAGQAQVREEGVETYTFQTKEIYRQHHVKEDKLYGVLILGERRREIGFLTGLIRNGVQLSKFPGAPEKLPLEWGDAYMPQVGRNPSGWLAQSRTAG